MIRCKNQSDIDILAETGGRKYVIESGDESDILWTGNPILIRCDFERETQDMDTDKKIVAVIKKISGAVLLAVLSFLHVFQMSTARKECGLPFELTVPCDGINITAKNADGFFERITITADSPDCAVVKKSDEVQIRYLMKTYFTGKAGMLLVPILALGILSALLLFGGARDIGFILLSVTAAIVLILLCVEAFSYLDFRKLLKEAQK